MRLRANKSDAQRIRKLLRQNHVKQKELAEDLGMPAQTLSNKLNGLRPFTLRDLSGIADYFEVSLDYLTCRSDVPNMEVVSND